MQRRQQNDWDGITVYYDGECPFCSRYVSMVRLRQFAEVRLVDVRADVAIRASLESEGFNLDEGMVVDLGGQRLGGADAANLLAKLSTRNSAFNRINYALLSNRSIAKLVYPALRFGRWLSLFAIGRSLIGEDRRGAAKAEIFGIMFALFSIFHFFNYTLEYLRLPPSIDIVAVLMAAIVLFFRAGSPRALFVLMAVSSVSTVLQAPVDSNHTMVRMAVLIGYWIAFVATALRNRPATEIFRSFAPSGQAALLVMYFFGIFHKLNTDFLNPETSCATKLWSMMPYPLSTWQGSTIDFLAIYGTFAAEAVIAISLLFRRTRHVGIAAGIGFHLLLSLSSYAMYVSFTMLSIALHTLFLTEGGARKVLDAPLMALVRSRMQDRIYQVAALLVMGLFAALAFVGHYSLATLAILPLAAPFCYLVLRHGMSRERLWSSSRAGPAIGIVIGALFFLNCALPYLGLKTAQSINMFANLRLEGGVSNHLVFERPPGPFHYLDDVATIESDGGSGYLAYYKRNGRGIVYHDLLAHLADNPSLEVSYVLHGVRYVAVDAALVRQDIDATVVSRPLRKWFFFRPVTLDRPEPCSK